MNKQHLIGSAEFLKEMSCASVILTTTINTAKAVNEQLAENISYSYEDDLKQKTLLNLEFKIKQQVESLLGDIDFLINKKK